MAQIEQLTPDRSTLYTGVGLEGIKAASLKRVEPSQQGLLEVYFDQLIG